MQNRNDGHICGSKYLGLLSSIQPVKNAPLPQGDEVERAVHHEQAKSSNDLTKIIASAHPASHRRPKRVQ